MLRVVADRGPGFGGQSGEARVGDEGVRPQPVVDLLLGDGPWAVLDQELEELERLGRELASAGAQQLPRAGVEDALTEVEPQCR